MRMMRAVQAVVRAFLLGGLVLGWATPSGASIPFTAILTGAEEVPAVVTPASGQFDLLLDDVAGAYLWTLTLFDIENPLLFAHIHAGVTGVNGAPIQFLFDISGLPFALTGDNLVFRGIGATPSVLSGLHAILGGAPSGLYVNVHSEAYPGGEIRGQLVPEPGTLALVSAGLLGLTLLGRRRSSLSV